MLGHSKTIIDLIAVTQTQKPTRADLVKLDGTESFFTSDEYLVPIVENDPLLREYPTIINHM